MAGPVASYVQLPSDTANTGKKNRTQTRAVGSDTVHEHFVVPNQGYTRIGRYVYQSTGDTIQASSGKQYAVLSMATNATAVASIKSIDVGWGTASTVNVASRASLITFLKSTFNNAMTDATTRAIGNYQSTQTAATLSVRSSSSGASLGTQTPVAAFYVPGAMTTVGAYGGQANVYQTGEHYQRASAIELNPGEALVVFQQDAGVASDVRTIQFRIVWDEIDQS